MKQIIVISGVTGFVGNTLRQYFSNKGYRIKGLTRSEEQGKKLEQSGVQPVVWNPYVSDGWEKELENSSVIINLVGENITSLRWTKVKKRKILLSRVIPTKRLAETVAKLKKKPDVFIQASAVGFYGTQEDKLLDERSSPGEGFLTDVVKQWETAPLLVKQVGVRLVFCRFGIILGKEKGYLKNLSIPFRFLGGAYIGTGKHWLSWIHIKDVCRAVDFLVTCKKCHNAYNLTAPHPVNNIEFTHTLARIMHRPALIRIPGSLVRLITGEMGEQLFLASQRAVPARLLKMNFSFEFPDLQPALENLISH